ncbi:hypothetical protein [Mycobacterium sp.]|uniref:hypothetical protein n=1 Tax=Mycobacterium sp. TaxID=1785 RepID=UPI003A89D81E
MPNRRRRKLSTAMSAVAALAVASPCAYFLVYQATADTKPVEHHEFVRAASIADLPGELLGALSQGLSQFGVNLPPVPALNTSGASTGLDSTGLGMSPGLTSPGLGGTDYYTSPALTPGLSPYEPGVLTPLSPTDPSGVGINPALTNPGLTSPTGLTPGLTSPTGLTPGLTSPTGLTPGLTSPTGLSPVIGTGEVPISAPIGLDPGLDGTYPILGDTYGLGGYDPYSPYGPAATGSTGSGGLVNDLMDVANQLGAGQAIDLLKGLVMPAITQGMQGGGAAAPAATPALPTAPGVPAVAGIPAAGVPAAGVPSAGLPAAAGVPAAAAPVGVIPGPPPV